MSNAVLTKLQEERAAAVDFVDGLLGQVTEENRDLVETEQRSLESYRERIAEIDKQMAPIAAFEEMRASAVQIEQRTTPKAAGFVVNERRPEATLDSFDVGTAFTESEQFRAYRGGTSGRFKVDVLPSDIGLETRAVLTEGAAPGKNMLPSVPKYTAPGAALRTPLLDAITRIPVSTSSVDVITYGQEATGATVVPEGDEKPEATLTTSVTPTPIPLIAAWVQATRQLLDDAPAARQLINSQLTRGVLRNLEEEVTSVVKAATTTTTGASGADLLTVARMGIAQVQSNGFQPNVIMASPANMAGLDLSVLGLGGAAAAVTQNGYFGLLPVPVPGLGADEVFVADAAAAMVLFERSGGVDLFITDSDIIGAGATAKSAFRSNVITLLAEVRAKAAIVNQMAVTKLVLTP